jgi:hypothetical protein
VNRIFVSLEPPPSQGRCQADLSEGEICVIQSRISKEI